MTSIVVQFRKEGFHFWANAPDEVAFLRSNHRHEFHYRIEIEVFENDRELEFFMVKRWLDPFIPAGELGGSSCEMLCTKILTLLKYKYGNRRYSVSVFEDGENGAVVTA